MDVLASHRNRQGYQQLLSARHLQPVPFLFQLFLEQRIHQRHRNLDISYLEFRGIECRESVFFAHMAGDRHPNIFPPDLRQKSAMNDISIHSHLLILNVRSGAAHIRIRRKIRESTRSRAQRLRKHGTDCIGMWIRLRALHRHRSRWLLRGRTCRNIRRLHRLRNRLTHLRCLFTRCRFLIERLNIRRNSCRRLMHRHRSRTFQNQNDGRDRCEQGRDTDDSIKFKLHGVFAAVSPKTKEP